MKKLSLSRSIPKAWRAIGGPISEESFDERTMMKTPLKQIAAALLVLLTLSTCARAEMVSSNFESLTSTDFILGTDPVSARFTGGLYGIRGVVEAYFSGSYSWMVFGGDTGLIDFTSPATEVSFYATDAVGGDGTLRVYSPSNSLLTTISDVPDSPQFVKNFEHFSFTEATLGSPIGRIEFENADPNINSMSVIDDIVFIVTPEPSSWLLAVIGLGMLGASAWRTRAARH